ncbi:MAG: DUF5320 domain-containing protein [Bacteroidales bacterium]
MPNYDRTGPTGEGPMTGRKEGLCNPETKAQAEEELQENRKARQGLLARGLGLARGFRGGRAARRRGNRPGRGMGEGNRFGNK